MLSERGCLNGCGGPSWDYIDDFLQVLWPAGFVRTRSEQARIKCDEKQKCGCVPLVNIIGSSQPLSLSRLPSFFFHRERARKRDRASVMSAPRDGARPDAAATKEERYKRADRASTSWRQLSSNKQASRVESKPSKIATKKQVATASQRRGRKTCGRSSTARLRDAFQKQNLENKRRNEDDDAILLSIFFPGRSPADHRGCVWIRPRRSHQ